MVSSYIGVKKSNFLRARDFLRLGPGIKTIRALERRLRSLGWRLVLPEDDTRAIGRNPMAKARAMPPGVPSIVITNRGPLVHAPTRGYVLDDRSRVKIYRYYSMDPTDTAPKFWDRLLNSDLDI